MYSPLFMNSLNDVLYSQGTVSWKTANYSRVLQLMSGSYLPLSLHRRQGDLPSVCAVSINSSSMSAASELPFSSSSCKSCWRGPPMSLMMLAVVSRRDCRAGTRWARCDWTE